MRTIKVLFIDVKSIKFNRSRVEAIVSPDRIKKANSLVREEDALLSLGAGYLIRRFVGEYSVDKNGKPVSDKTFFSVSHSGKYAAIAVSDARIGLDIEKIRPRNDAAFRKRMLSEAEAAECEALDAAEIITAKESLGKADGEGLKNGLRALPALPQSGEVDFNGRSYHRRKACHDGYIVSVTVEGKDFAIETENIAIIDL